MCFKVACFCLGETVLEVDNEHEVPTLAGSFFWRLVSMTTRPAHRLTSALRNHRFSLIALWAIALTPLWVVAQSGDGPREAGQIVPPPPVDSRIVQSASVGVPVTVRGPCDPDYWIISTRSANEQIECGQAANMEVFRFDGPNPGRASSMEELISSLQPGVPVCFMAHGSFVTWESVLNDSARTYPWLRQAAPCRPVHLIFYTWASDDGSCIPHLRVNKFGRRAALNGFYLADLVSKVGSDHPICLIGHSHGTRLVSAALHSMAGGVVEGKVLATGVQPPRHIRVVMAAAAINHDWLNPDSEYGRALFPAEAVINLRNRKDFPLQFYPLRKPISARALGVTGLTERDRAELGVWNQKLIDYDVTESIGLGHIWAHYYSQPAIASAIRHYVYYDEYQPAP